MTSGIVMAVCLAIGIWLADRSRNRRKRAEEAGEASEEGPLGVLMILLFLGAVAWAVYGWMTSRPPEDMRW